MNDPANPTDEEIKAWAYSGADFPMQDWGVICFDNVTNNQRALLVFDIAKDKSCPNRAAFLSFLSVMTGSVVRFAVRDGLHHQRLSVLVPLISKAIESEDEDLRAWAQRSQAVIADPTTFHYEDWYT